MVLPDGWAAPFEALIVLAAVLFASGRRRPALAGLAALLAVGAAIGSALPARAIAAFYSTADQLEVGIPLPLAAVALLLLAAWVRLGRGAADGFGESIARFVLLSLGLAGAGTLVVLVAASALGGAAEASPAIPLAILRSAVLAASAIILALLRRRTGLAELPLARRHRPRGAGGKLLVDEMRLGKAGAVVAGLALYGIALIAAPRLSKRPVAAPVPAA